MKILITGAHFTPALAVVEELKKKGVKIVYVGRKTTLEGDLTQSQESKILPSLGIKFIPLLTGRLQRSLTIYTPLSLLKIPLGFIQALYIILSEKPNVILSFGGYVAVPMVIAGWLFSVPILVHEQTLISGLANKISAHFADKIALSFMINHQYDQKPKVVTGNPLRKNILHPDKKLPADYQPIFHTARKEKLPIILITCGNQGSHLINLTVEACLNKLIKMACVIHISGDNKFKDYERLKRLQNEHYLVKEWIGKEYGALLSKVNLVISRAGANTLYELAYLGKPALVIPLPYLYQDEQNKNAKFFEQLGLVKILPQSKLSGNSLLENVKLMLNLDVMSEDIKNAKSVTTAEAAKRLALEVVLLAAEK